MSDPLYYYALQTEARSRVQQSLNANILRRPGAVHHFDKLTLCSIQSPDMEGALTFADEVWPQHYGDSGWTGFGVSWHKIVKPRMAAPDAFDLAIWQEIEGEQVLAALAFGEPSHARTHLTLKWLERFMGYTHVAGRVTPIVLACAEEYAKLLGSDRVLIKDALVPKLYERYGYRTYRHPYVAHGGDYMSKELTNG